MIHETTQTNMHMLEKVNWEDLSFSLTMRTSSSGKNVGCLQLAVEKATGKILDVSDRPVVPEGSIVSLIGIEETGDPNHPKIELMDKSSPLPEGIREFVTRAFEEFNKS